MEIDDFTGGVCSYRNLRPEIQGLFCQLSVSYLCRWIMIIVLY